MPGLIEAGQDRRPRPCSFPHLPRRPHFYLSVELGPAIRLAVLALFVNPIAAPVSSAPSIWAGGIRVFNPPRNPVDWPSWRKLLNDWRAEQRRTNSDANYRKRGFEWVSSCYAECFSVIYDSQFYDGKKGGYDVDGLTDYYRREYGGLDAIVIWPLSPQIGFDDRNQFDFYRNMPGGLAGLRQAVDRFHQRGVKVLINNNPVDAGSFHHDNLRPESPTNPGGEPEAIAAIVRAIDADGVFLNTYAFGGSALRNELDRIRPGIVIEGEFALSSAEQVMEQHMGWFKADYVELNGPYLPGAVMRDKWLERKHMSHVVARERKDHSDEIHIAWMNGVGVVMWENVFGIWRGWNQRDRSLLRSILPVQKRYTRLFSGEGWTPGVATLQDGVSANLWESDGIRLWTLINESDQRKAGALLRVADHPGDRYFEAIAGREIKAEISGGRATLDDDLNPRGAACIVAGATSALGADFSDFLMRQSAIKSRENLDTAYRALPVVLKPVRPTSRFTPADVPKEMVIMPRSAYLQRDTVTPRESGAYDSEHYNAGGTTLQQVQVGPFAIDREPVTNAQFLRFVQASGYSPAARENFLKLWLGGLPPAGKENEPVVYVDLDDARAYATWAGKRLPTKEEWQYAMESGRIHYGSVRVWEWNESERADGRTRFCMLKGGSDWLPKGSPFYAPGFIPDDAKDGRRDPDYSAKFILTWPGLDRLWTVGFRCAVDM
jgi:hypothetical protein